MTAVILPVVQGDSPQEQQKHIQVMVHVQAEILNPVFARRRANQWLSMKAGHLLLVDEPELLLGDALQWRFDVFLSAPQLTQPGTAH
jgi:hypothetical protein